MIHVWPMFRPIEISTFPEPCSVVKGLDTVVSIFFN